METGCVQVLATVDARERAEALATHLVEDGLAACVQVAGPIASTYRWRGSVERAEEWLMVMKTTAEAYPHLEQVVRERHPYEVPEITAIPITDGLTEYLAWIREGVRPA